MSASVQHWLPAVSARLEALAQAPMIVAINQSTWLFSAVQLLHLLAIAVLGGAVLVLNLRLLGLALPTLTPHYVERHTRPWMIGSIVGTVLTGFLLTLSTTQTSLGNTAFLVKMIALLAAILLSVSVASQVREGTPAPGRAPQVLAGVAAFMWVIAVALFASAANLGAGVLLVAITGFALFAAFVPGRRKGYLAGVGFIMVAGLGATFFLPPSESGDALAGQLSMGTVIVALAFALVLWAGEEREGGPAPLAPERASALVSTLAWVTVAVAGRWIGFS